jgi:hypothetical protein
MLEDWGAMSNFPGLKIYAPYNKTSAKNIFDKTSSYKIFKLLEELTIGIIKHNNAISSAFRISKTGITLFSDK